MRRRFLDGQRSCPINEDGGSSVAVNTRWVEAERMRFLVGSGHGFGGGNEHLLAPRRRLTYPQGDDTVHVRKPGLRG